MAKMLLDLKEDVKLRARAIKKELFAYILKNNLHTYVFQQLEASIIVFPTRWMVESAFSVTLNVFNKKKQIGQQQQRKYQIKIQ